MADYTNLKPIDLNKIQLVNFPENQYFKEVQNKTQIVIHHTVSGPGVEGDINTWLGNSSRVATGFIIGRSGIPYQCFSSKYWGIHLFRNSDIFLEYGYNQSAAEVQRYKIEKCTIGVELDSWGPLTKKGDKYMTAYGTDSKLTDDEVIYYQNGHRGYNYFEKYTEEQLRTLGELILFWSEKYDIPVTYNSTMWNVCKDALNGNPGIWSHVTYRKDKNDAHPDPELIKMLMSL